MLQARGQAWLLVLSDSDRNRSDAGAQTDLSHQNQRGGGPIDALVHALALTFDVLSCEGKSMGKGSEARPPPSSTSPSLSRLTLFGVGMHANIIIASILAVLSAVRRECAGLLPAARVVASA